MDSGLLQPLAKILLLVGVGVICRLLGIITKSGIEQLKVLILQVTLPIMLFVSMGRGSLSSLVHQGGLVFICGILVPLLGYVLGAGLGRLFRLSPEQASVVRVNVALSNTSFVGFPVCTALWGAAGSPFAVSYDAGMSLVLVVLAPWGYGRSSRTLPWREVFLNPVIWGALLGAAWSALGLPLSGWPADAIAILGDATMPLSLLLVGALAEPSKVRIGELLPLTAYLLGRLAVVPAAAWLLACGLKLADVPAAIVVMEAAMPASIVATVMAQQYDADTRLAATGAFLSVPLSFATIPLLAALTGIR
ncbi:MAG TPA: AEC family transporter [Anaerolineae bacterium]|nr:AEC family transporter [Anaerolineae bacterium]HPL27921.1 AEC family transporter [Anaerolineae bacterium]